MVLIWSLSQHVGRRVTCLPAAATAATTRQLLHRFFVNCHSCHAYRKHCDGVLLWRNRTQNYHRLGGRAATGKSCKVPLWRQQQAMCLASSGNRILQQHKTRPSFTANTDQNRNSAWKTFSAENRYFYKSLRRDEKYQDYFVSAIDKKTLNEFHEKMIETSKIYNAFDYHFTNFCTSTAVSGIKKKFDPYETQFSKSISLFDRLISDLHTNNILLMVRRYHETVRQFSNETIDSAFPILLQSVTKELSKRISSMPPRDIFRVADLLYVTGFHRQNMVIKSVIQRCMSDLDILNIPEQRILFFFYLGLERVSRRGVTVEMQDQEEMVGILDNCNINEIGVISLGMFRAEIQLKSEKLGLLIVKKLEENLNLCHTITLSAILKFIEFTVDRRLSDKFSAIYTALTDKTFVTNVVKAVPGTTMKDMPWLMRVCRLYSSIRFCPEEVLQAVIRKVLEIGATHMRLKDMAELLRFSNFGYNSDSTQEFYTVLKQDLLHRETVEFEKHIVHIAMAISSFIHVGVYPLSLVELLFSEEWLKKAGDKKFYFSRLPYVISESVKLERPDYGGPLLPTQYSDRACEQHWYLQEIRHAHIKSQMGDGTMRAQFTVALEEALASYLGDGEYFNAHMFLPHFFSSDFGLAVNEIGNVIPVKDWCTPDGHLKQEASCTRFAIVPLIERDALFTFMDVAGNKSQCMVSKTLMKLRQLKLLGFNVVHIFQKEFMEYDNKQDLLHDKLSPFLGKLSLSSEGKVEV